MMTCHCTSSQYNSNKGRYRLLCHLHNSVCLCQWKYLTSCLQTQTTKTRGRFPPTQNKKVKNMGGDYFHTFIRNTFRVSQKVSSCRAHWILTLENSHCPLSKLAVQVEGGVSLHIPCLVHGEPLSLPATGQKGYGTFSGQVKRSDFVHAG